MSCYPPIARLIDELNLITVITCTQPTDVPCPELRYHIITDDPLIRAPEQPTQHGPQHKGRGGKIKRW